MPKLIKIILYSVGAWLAALVLLFSLPVSGIAGFSYLLSFLAGAFLFTLAAISLILDKDKIAAVMAMLLVVVTAWLTLTKSSEWGARIHFQFNRGKYEAKLAEVLSAGDEAERRRRCGDECSIMSHDRVIISFNYSRGFLNWYSFVYDPTGAATESEEGKPVRLYYFRSEARHLGGDWYWVHFSD